MPRIKFEQRPLSIRLRPLAESSPEYVRTPYPAQLLLKASSSPTTSTMDERKVYYTSREVLSAEFLEETKSFFRNKCPSAPTHDGSDNPRIHLICGFSQFIIDENWEIRLPHPLHPHPFTNNFEKSVYTHHIIIEFLPGGPKFEEWEDIAKEFQDSILSKYSLLHAAVEFTQLGGYGITSAWYPPQINKDKLRFFFGSDDSDGPDSEPEEQE